MSMGQKLDDNVKLGKICDGLFYKTGNLGYKVLGELVTMPEKEFDRYLLEVEELCKNDGISQDFE